MIKFILPVLLVFSIPGCDRKIELQKNFKIIKHTYFKSGTKLSTVIFSSNAKGTKFYEQLRKSDGTVESEIREYKEIGNVIKISIFGNDRKLKKYIIQQYKPESRVIIKRIVFSEKNNLISYTIYKYDNEGRLLEKKNYDSQDRLHGFTFFFDEKGRINMDKYYKSGLLILKTYNEYDKEDNIIEVTKYKSKGKLYSKRIFIYDENNNIIKNISYNNYNQIVSKVISSYNKNNNRIEVVYYENNKGKLLIKFKKKFTYDDKNNLSRVKTFAENNKIQSSGLYKYDSNGNKIKQSYFDSRGELIGFSIYDYD